MPYDTYDLAGIKVGDTARSSDRAQRALALLTSWPIAVCLIAVAVLGGLAFRWSNLGKLSLWWDEGFTEWAANLSASNIIRFARNDNQAPVYYLLQHYWNTLFGNSEFGLRALAALFGTLSLPVFYLFARKVLKDRMAAVFALWLFAFSTRQIWYSREARTYEAASFFALLGLYALIVFLEQRSAASFVTVVLSLTITLYLHNMMFFYLLAVDLIWLTYPCERALTLRVKEAFAANCLAGVLFLPWVVSLLTQVKAVGGNLWWVPRPTGATLVHTLSSLAGLDPDYLSVLATRFFCPPAHTAQACALAVVLLLYAVMLLGGIWKVSKQAKWTSFSLVLYCLLPVLLVFALSQKLLPLYIDRVFTPSSIVVPIIFALPLAFQKGPKGRRLYGVLAIVFGLATALSAFGFLRYHEAKAKNDEDWRATTRQLANLPETNRLILFVPPAGEILFDYYARRLPPIDPHVQRLGLPASYHEQFAPPGARTVDSREVDRLKATFESRKFAEVDLVLTHDVDPNGLLSEFLDRRYFYGLVHGDQAVSQIKTVRFIVPRP